MRQYKTEKVKKYENMATLQKGMRKNREKMFARPRTEVLPGNL